MDMTVVTITEIVCSTLIILNVIWIFKVKADTKRIEAETKDKEAERILKFHGPIR